MYILYPISYICDITFQKRISTQIVTTNPFFMPYLASFFGRKRSGIVVSLLYDLYPDALEVSGILKKNSFGSRLLSWITEGALRRCEVTVFIGKRLREHVENRYGQARRACVIPVGADGTPFRKYAPSPSNEESTIKLLYCGNLGRLHDYRTLYDALTRVPLEINTSLGKQNFLRKLKISIHGNGSGYQKFRNLAKETSIRRNWELDFGGNLEGERWETMMRDAEVAIVTLSVGAEKIMMPSKVYSALVAGQAILAICALKSDLADLVYTYECGWVVEPGDVDGLIKTLNIIALNRAQLQEKRENAYRAGHEKFELSIVAEQWKRLFETLNLHKYENEC
jgi:glycosyltransferase involved in cell wall biosynthesis